MTGLASSGRHQSIKHEHEHEHERASALPLSISEPLAASASPSIPMAHLLPLGGWRLGRRKLQSAIHRSRRIIIYESACCGLRSSYMDDGRREGCAVKSVLLTQVFNR